MAPGTGCTQILPRSHRLNLATPDDDAGAHAGVEDFLPRMEDVVVWDQRAWHRRGLFTPQSKDDVRCIPNNQVAVPFLASRVAKSETGILWWRRCAL